jgi:hypothetical protein
MIWSSMKFLMAFSCAAALAAAACGDPVPPAAPSVAPSTITESLSGTLPVAGSSLQNITVSQVGKMSVTLTSVTPAVAVGIGVGTPSSGTCVLLDSRSPVVAGSTVLLSGTALAGNLCVSVFDIGNLVENVTYTIEVSHS